MIALLLALTVSAEPTAKVPGVIVISLPASHCVYSRKGDVLYVRCWSEQDRGSDACAESLAAAVALESDRLAAVYAGRGTVGYADVDGRTVSWRITTPMGERDLAVFVTFSLTAGLWCPGPRTENEL